MQTLQSIILISTDVLDIPITKLTSFPGTCLRIVQRVQALGRTWDEHPDWHGRTWYVQLLLAVASLSRVVEWFEAERAFWNFDEGGGGGSVGGGGSGGGERGGRGREGGRGTPGSGYGEETGDEDGDGDGEMLTFVLKPVVSRDASSSQLHQSQSQSQSSQLHPSNSQHSNSHSQHSHQHSHQSLSTVTSSGSNSTASANNSMLNLNLNTHSSSPSGPSPIPIATPGALGMTTSAGPSTPGTDSAGIPTEPLSRVSSITSASRSTATAMPPPSTIPSSSLTSTLTSALSAGAHALPSSLYNTFSNALPSTLSNALTNSTSASGTSLSMSASASRSHSRPSLLSDRGTASREFEHFGSSVIGDDPDEDADADDAQSLRGRVRDLVEDFGVEEGGMQSMHLGMGMPPPQQVVPELYQPQPQGSTPEATRLEQQLEQQADNDNNNNNSNSNNREEEHADREEAALTHEDRAEASETLRIQAEEAQSVNVVLELTLDGEGGQQFAWINPAWWDVMG